MRNLKPKKLDTFIAQQFGVLFAGAFLICQFVLMMQFLWRYVDELIGKGLSLEVMAQFFWYMGLMLVPQALPLAILLSSLITFGNLGESSELTAIKAAGISLMQSFRSLILICILICVSSFIFQNYVGPEANLRLRQLLLSMRQKSPELEIPEGIFYDGIPRSNIFVQKKDIRTGMLYGLTIYRMTGSYEDQAIILADSGMLQSTADKKHLLMTLWNGEWFENMQSQELGNKASVPYRRETFYNKRILIDFDGDFSLTDATMLANDARSKGLPQLIHDIDSIKERQDSTGRALYKDMTGRFYHARDIPAANKQPSPGNTGTKKENTAANARIVNIVNIDTVYASLTPNEKQTVITNSLNLVNNNKNELDFRGMISQDYEKIIRTHRMQEISKFTIALQCILFFFIGAPLGAIIRKGGLGLPVIISVLVFIVYYILDNSSSGMVKNGTWNLWFGCLLSTIVLTPLAIFFTYKANHDSAVLNFDVYKEFLFRLLMIRNHRHIFPKEVIINDPQYSADTAALTAMNGKIDAYENSNTLDKLPDPLKIFFTSTPDNEIEEINKTMEDVIEDLNNSRDKIILSEISRYPIITTNAHKRPFGALWMNAATAVLLPAGIFFYVRIVIFRFRLHRDLQTIRQTSENIIAHISNTQ